MKSYTEIINTTTNINGGYNISGYIYINRDNITIDYNQTYYFYNKSKAQKIHKEKLVNIKKLYNKGSFTKDYYNHIINIDNEILNYS